MIFKHSRFFRLRIIELSVTIVILLTVDLYAQEIHFRHLTSDDGLSQNFVPCILQDRKGFMWFGTKDGLNRYDGYQFKVFRNNPFDTTTISDNWITALYEDKEGKLWIGSSGLDVFDPLTETVIRIKINNNNPSKLPLQIQSINQDKFGKIWIGSNDGLFIYNFSNQQIKHFIHDPADKSSISNNNIRAIYIDDLTVYIGTGRGLNVINLDKSKPDKINFKTIKLAEEDGTDLSQIALTSFYRSTGGLFYAGTPEGLLKINLASGRCKLYKHSKNVFAEQWKGRIISICSDKNENLWLASSGALVIFNTVTEKYKYIFQNPVDTRSLSFNGILSVYADRGGKIWIGTPGKGLNIYDEYSKEFKLYNGYFDKEPFQTSFSVNSILSDMKNNLWVVSGDNLYLIDRNTNEYKKVIINKMKIGAILNMVEDDEANLWFATDNGFFKRDVKNGNVTEYQPIIIDPSELFDKSNRYLFKDTKGNLWFFYSGYISKLDKQSGSFTQTKLNFRNIPESEVSSISCIYESSNGFLWFAWSDQLIKFNPSSNTSKIYSHKISNRKTINYYGITSIVEDPIQPNKYLWMGTLGGGLNRFDLTENTYTHYLTQDGLPNNIIYGILSSKNEFWLSTNNGLCRVRTDKYGQPTFRNYDVSDGLQGNEFNTSAFCKNKKGEMFFGGLYGITAFYPEKIRDNIFVPPISLVALNVLSVAADNSKPYSGKQIPITEQKKIVLPYDQNTFTIDFAALDFTATEKNRYVYQLKKLNKTPVEIGTQRSITFTDLPPGKYEFFVKGSNNDGIWNETGASIEIIITPPFWKTMWAYTVYFILLVAMIYGIRKYEMNRIRLKNNLKQESFEREKLKELDNLKSEFFTNISHEFRTPLTLIIGPAQQLESEENNEEKKDKLKVIKKSAKRLLRLINQLLDLSKIENGKSKIKCSENDIVIFTKGIANSFVPLAETKKIALTFSSDVKEIITFFDKDVVEKILYNLISNAFKFTPVNGRIEVNVSANDKNLDSIKNNFCKISVKDSGSGIPEDQINLIFNKFYQANLYSELSDKGSGIGLALVKELVEIHHGKISVESEVGKGSVFTITMPIGRDYLTDEEIVYEGLTENLTVENHNLQILDADNDNLIVNNNSDTKRTTGNDDSLIVLVVEDNIDVQTYICKQLEKEYNTITASNGKEGFEKAVQLIPDFIISDIMMPDSDGMELCRKIKSDGRTSHIPVILLTAKADEKDKLEGLEIGADDYLTKPFSPKELQVRVKNLIESRQKLRQKFSGSIILKPKEVNVSSIDQSFLERALEVVEKNINNEKFTVIDFSDAMNLSHSQLHRKLKALTNQSANHFIRSVRMERALDLLKSNTGNIADIAYKVGFNDPGYFTKTFSAYFGYLPSEVKEAKKV
ncbi:MAG: two-component regulator propeller domain-containing protein [Ignavibacteriaceae bacterium]